MGGGKQEASESEACLGCRPGVSTKPKQQKPIASYLVSKWWEIRFSFKKINKNKESRAAQTFRVHVGENETLHPHCEAYKAPAK